MGTEIQAKEQQHESICHVKVAKGRRTKRQRTCSTHDTPMCVSSGGGGGDNGDDSSSTLPSPAPFRSCTTKGNQKQKEDEMARYLILLAQGDDQNPNKTGCKIDSAQCNNLLDMSTASTTTNSSMCNYRCKTCNRTFSSFQALGGHRASHKKYKATIEEKFLNLPKVATIANNGGEAGPKELLNFNNRPLGVQIDKKTLLLVKPKLRVCLICGMEFTSGQALGGHMRRHRVSLNADVVIQKRKENLLIDLNLPAPPEEDDCYNNIPSTSSQQPLILSNPALAGCHY